MEIKSPSREAPARKLTYEEFLEWLDEDTWAEWVDGEVVMLSPASRRHQEVRHFLETLIKGYAELHDLGVVLSAPFQVKLEEVRRGREPDLLFVTKEHLERLKDAYLDGPPDLAVEIVSPESVSRDRGEKFYEYAQAGVPEYWLIDPQIRWADFYHLESEAKRYRPAFSGEEGVYRSGVLPGFWLKVEWLWQEPLPPLDEVLLEVGGEAYAKRAIERLRRRGFLS